MYNFFMRDVQMRKITLIECDIMYLRLNELYVLLLYYIIIYICYYYIYMYIYTCIYLYLYLYIPTYV